MKKLFTTDNLFMIGWATLITWFINPTFVDARLSFLDIPLKLAIFILACLIHNIVIIYIRRKMLLVDN